MADTAGGASAPASTSSQDPQANSASPQSPPADLEPWKKVKHKVKVDGNETEVGYDDLVTDYQLRQASNARLRQAAEQQKQLQDLWNRADPDAFFKARKMDPHEWAEKILIDRLKLQKMSPEERKAHEVRLQEQEEREAFKRDKEAFEEGQKQTITQQAVRDLDSQITNAFKAIGRSPDPLLVDLMARRMEMDLDNDQAPNAERALAFVTQDLDRRIQHRLENMTADDLRQALPKKLLDDLRKQDVELVRSQSPARSNGQQGTSRPPSPKGKARGSTDSWFSAIEEKLSS